MEGARACFSAAIVFLAALAQADSPLYATFGRFSVQSSPVWNETAKLRADSR